MRTLTKILSMLLAALFAMPAFAAEQGLYAFADVTVVPMDRERLIPGQTVIVRNGRIESISAARSAKVPAGATRIDGRGRYLMPGLAEMHAHVPPNPAQAQWTKDVLFLYAANGITFVRSMLGAPHHLELRAKAQRGEMVTPLIYTSGPSLNGNSVASPEAARKMIAEQKAAGYDTLKIHPGLDRPRYDAVAQAAREHKITFGGHVPEAVGLARALEVGQVTVDHLDGYMTLLLAPTASAADQGFFGTGIISQVDETKIPAVARRTRQAGVWNVPTFSLFHHNYLPGISTDEMVARPEMRYVPRAMLAQWKKVRDETFASPTYSAAEMQRYARVAGKLIKALHDDGAGLLLGSDAPQRFNVPGFSLHRELTYLVGVGLSPYEALATGTRNVSRFLGTPAAFGTVQPGRRADLLLLEANPLANVSNAERRAGVMLNGRWLPEAKIQAGLAEISARYAN